MSDVTALRIADFDREIDAIAAEGEARGHCPHCLAAYRAFMRAAVRVRTAHAEAGLTAAGATACSLVGLANTVAYLLVNDLPAERHGQALAQLDTMARKIIAAPRAVRVDPKTH